MRLWHSVWQLVKRMASTYKAPFLRRPKFQTKTEDRLSHLAITERRPEGTEYLERCDQTIQAKVAHDGENQLSRFMRSMVCVYMHPAIRNHGWLWLDDILDHPKYPEETRKTPRPVTFHTTTGTLTPDRLGIDPRDKRVCFPICNSDNSISAFIGSDPKRGLKLPPQWLASSEKVIRLKRS